MEIVWNKLRDKIKTSIKTETKKVRRWRIGDKIWHSKEWKERKRKLRKELRELRKGKIDKEEYVYKRREHKEWCKSEKERHARKEEAKINLLN